jgi:hypothetical protein
MRTTRHGYTLVYFIEHLLNGCDVSCDVIDMDFIMFIIAFKKSYGEIHDFVNLAPKNEF